MADDKDPSSIEEQWLSLRTSRRQFLRAAAGTVAAASLGVWSGILGTGENSAGLRVASADEQTLRDVALWRHALPRGVLYGAAAIKAHLENDAPFAKRFAEECYILVPESSLKWSTLRPSRDVFNFRDGDWLSDFAEQHGMLFRGHTLVWHGAVPGWLAKTINPGNAAELLLEHIERVVRHYAGRVHSWDVVNEAIEPRDGQPNSLRKSLWLDNYGPNYIADAFRAVSMADRRAMLVYNDYGLEYNTRADGARRAAVLNLLTRLKAEGVPVHALGMQAHLRSEWTKEFDPGLLRSFLREVADLGLKIMVTELDVSDQALPTDEKERDIGVADAYKRYLDVVLAEPSVISVTTWGLSDRYTWLTRAYPRSDKTRQRPLPLDADLRPKAAWRALAEAFKKAPNRSRIIKNRNPWIFPY